MKNTLLLLGLAFSFTAFGQALYEEGFEDFAAGDYISDHPCGSRGPGQEGTEATLKSAAIIFTGVHICTSAAGGPWTSDARRSQCICRLLDDVSPTVTPLTTMSKRTRHWRSWRLRHFRFTGDLQIVMDGITVVRHLSGEWFRPP